MYFSICIPTYDRKNFLLNAVNSALNQVYKNFEIIIVDDGSEFDVETEIKKKFGDSRIRVYRNECNQGRPYSRNRCIDLANGDFILWLDDDDTLYLETLEKYVSLIRKYPDIDIGYGNLNVINSFRLKRITPLDFHEKNEFLFENLCTKGNSIPNPGTIVRKEIYKRFGNYDMNLKRAQDYEFWIRVSLLSNFKKSDYYVVNYLVHNGNISSLEDFNRFTDRSYESYALRKNLDKNNLKYLNHFEKVIENFFKIEDIINSLYYAYKFFNNSKIFDNYLFITHLKMNITIKNYNFLQNEDKNFIKKYEKLSKKLIKYFKQKNLKYFNEIADKINNMIGLSWLVSYHKALLYKDLGDFKLSKAFAFQSLRINPFSIESKNLAKELGIPEQEIKDFKFRILHPINEFETEKIKFLSQIFGIKE